MSIPPIQMPPLPARLPLPLSPSPSSSLTPNHVFPLHDYPQRPPTPNMWHHGLLFPNTGSKLHFLSADLTRTAFTAANRGPGDRTVGYTGALSSASSPLSSPQPTPTPSPPSHQSTTAPLNTGYDVLAAPTIPVAPPMSAFFPSCLFKVICRYCLRDDHDIRYIQCPNCYKKEVELIITAGNVLAFLFPAFFSYN